MGGSISPIEYQPKPNKRSIEKTNPTFTVPITTAVAEIPDQFYKPQYKQVLKNMTLDNYVQTIPEQNFGAIRDTFKTDMDINNAEYLYSRLKQAGLGEDQARTITAQSILETGVKAIDQYNNGPASGIMQWEKDRKQKMFAYKRKSEVPKGVDPEIVRQVDYLINEDLPNSWLDGGKGSGFRNKAEAENTFYNATSIDDLVRSSTHGFVRPGDRNKRIEELIKLLSSWS